jgi:hypothetical protein
MPTTDSEEAHGRMCAVSLLSMAVNMGDQLYHCSGASDASLSLFR